VLLLLSPWEEGFFVGALLFTLAVLTDIFDGYLARRGKSTSSLGVFLDLVADKVLVLAVLWLLAYLSPVPAWIALVISAREFVIMGFRWRAASKGRVIPAAAWGKGKTVITSAGIAAVIIGESSKRGAWATAINLAGWMDFVVAISIPLLAVATLLTLISGALYVRAALPVVLGTAQSQPLPLAGDHPSGEAISQAPQ
jgi:CDP-diacylglycerol--glycerol-3-phosphate 3-phosphatidyltransferase